MTQKGNKMTERVTEKENKNGKRPLVSVYSSETLRRRASHNLISVEVLRILEITKFHVYMCLFIDESAAITEVC